MIRRGPLPILPVGVQEAVDSEIRHHRDGLRQIRHIVCRADRGIISPAEANCLVFAETVRLLRDGVPR